MGTKYTSQGITGFDASPPPDDGAENESNKLTWAKHKTKLAVPIKDQVANINTAIVNMVDVDTQDAPSPVTLDADDNGRVIEVTGTTTITLGAPATMTSGYEVTIKCVSGTTTVDPAIYEIDGSTTDRTLTAGNSETYRVNAAADKYLLEAQSNLPFLDEDDLVSDSDVSVASQQSIKAYVDGLIASAAAKFSYHQVTSTSNSTIATTSTSPGAVGSSFAATIPTKGRITIFPEQVRIDTGGNPCDAVLGIQIGSTEYYGIWDDNGTIKHVPRFIRMGASQQDDFYGTFGNDTAQEGSLSIETLSIPTGVQTVQLVVYDVNGNSGSVLEGTSLTTKITVIIEDFT